MNMSLLSLKKRAFLLKLFYQNHENDFKALRDCKKYKGIAHTPSNSLCLWRAGCFVLEDNKVCNLHNMWAKTRNTVSG